MLGAMAIGITGDLLVPIQRPACFDGRRTYVTHRT